MPFELTLTTSSLNPGRPVGVPRQVVTLQIESEVEGVLHVPSDSLRGTRRGLGCRWCCS